MFSGAEKYFRVGANVQIVHKNTTTCSITLGRGVSRFARFANCTMCIEICRKRRVGEITDRRPVPGEWMRPRQHAPTHSLLAVEEFTHILRETLGRSFRICYSLDKEDHYLTYLLG